MDNQSTDLQALQSEVTPKLEENLADLDTPGTISSKNTDEGHREKVDIGDKDIDQADLTHKELMQVVRTSLNDIIEDPLLCDLPTDVTAEEINLQLALEYGQAMTVNVRRQDGEVLPVVVLQAGTVQDLKQALRSHIEMKQKRDGDIRPISWRYTWRTYWLAFEGQKLDEDNRKIKDYGIRNKDEVSFIKRLKVKEIGY